MPPRVDDSLQTTAVDVAGEQSIGFLGSKHIRYERT